MANFEAFRWNFSSSINPEIGRSVGEGINTYSKSLQELLGIDELVKLPTSQNPNIKYSWTECGIKKCTHVRGMFNTSFGETCVNHIGKYCL